MNVELLYYGTMNTHFRPNHEGFPDGKTLGSLFKDLADNGDIRLRIHVYTEDKGFFKWTPEKHVKEDSIHGYPLIAWIEDRYGVTQIDESYIRESLSELYGPHLGNVTVLNTTFSRSDWGSADESYKKAGTKNNWRNTLITTFFEKKKRAFELSQDAPPPDEETVYLLARPDSVFVAAPWSEHKDLHRAAKDDLERILQYPSDTLLFDRPSINDKNLQAARPVGMIKNDLIVARREDMAYNVSFHDVIMEECGGNYFETYSQPALRCNSCHFVDKPDTLRIPDDFKCPNCGHDRFDNVTEWPEYKMFEHLVEGGKHLRPTFLRGKVVR